MKNIRNDNAMGWVVSLVFAVISLATWGVLFINTVNVHAIA
jgi:hypothetical protein